MAVRQAAAELGDGGVVVGQLLLDRQRRCGTRPPPPPACPSASSRMPSSLIVSARSRRASFEAPGAAASASWSARARR